MPRVMLEKPDRLRVSSSARPVGVDRENRVLRGYVVAQAGPFKDEGRGEFDELSLKQILEQWPKAGLRSRFSHPNESSDGLGKYLGRGHDPFLSTTTNGAGETVPCVRADLHFDGSAFEKNPNGNLGEYIMTLAQNDPAALSSSLVLKKGEELRLNKDGSPKRGPDDKELPPLWRIERLFASDIVDEGAAVDGVLSVEPLNVEGLRWTRDYLAAGESLLNKLFAGQSRAVVQARCTAFLTRYLNRRYGGSNMENLGAGLAGVLNGYLDEKSGGDENARAGAIGGMAQESGLTTDEVIAILGGEDAGVTTPVLEGFSRALECPLGELVTAAEEDGIDLTGAGTGDEDPAEGEGGEMPAEPAAVPMSVRKKKLELAAKSH